MKKMRNSDFECIVIEGTAAEGVEVECWYLQDVDTELFLTDEKLFRRVSIAT